MPEPLTWDTVRRLRRDRAHRLTPGAAGTLVFAGGLVLLVTVMVAAPSPACTEADPCGPDRAGNLLIGMLVGTLFAGWVALRFAAVVGLVTSAGLAWYTLARPGEGPPLWTVTLAVSYPLGCVLLARRSDRPRREPWSDERRPVPALRGSFRPPAGPALAAVALVGAAVAVAFWCERAQERADARQAWAAVVTGTVRSHPERYDLTPWYSLVALLGVAGLGFCWRAAGQVRARWRFARHPQPVSWVHAEPERGVVRLYPLAEGMQSVGEIPVRAEDGLPGGGVRTRALLHGTPVHGEWCTVTIGGHTLSPREPLRPTPARSTGRSRDAEPEWPVLAVAGIVGTLLAVLGAMVVGIGAGASMLAGVLDLLCTGDRCQSVGLAAAGWGLLGGPVLLAAAVYRFARPGRVALVALAGCVTLLSFGLTVTFAHGDTVRELRPDGSALVVGCFAALAPILVGGLIARDAAARRSGPWSPHEPYPWPALLVMAVGEGVSLVGVLAWVALSG